MLLASRRGAHCAPDWGVSAKGVTYVPALHGGMRPARPPRAQEEGELMGFSSFCLRAAGEHAVRWSQPVGARIVRPIGAFRLKGQRMCPYFTGVNAACAAASRTRGGGTGWFPLPLANHHPFLQGALRAQKEVPLLLCRPAAPKGKQNGCHPRAAGAHCEDTAAPRGVVPVLLVAYGRWAAGGKKSLTFAREARPYLRQQMQKIFLLFARRSAPGEKGEGVIHKRGGTLVPPLLCACGA